MNSAETFGYLGRQLKAILKCIVGNDVPNELILVLHGLIIIKVMKI